jgi:ATP-binding cassette, subfamily B, bacterial
MDHFPHYFQSDGVASEITCMQIICKYYGAFRSTESLKRMELLLVNSNNIYDVIPFAEGLGFRARIINPHIEKIQHVNVPWIIKLRKEKRSVVLYKIKNGIAYISDPLKGKYRCAQHEFAQEINSGDGYPFCLMLEPGPGFNLEKQTESNNVTFTYLRSYLRPHKKLLVQVLLGFFAGGLLSLFLPFLTQSIVDHGIAVANIDFIILVLVAQILLILGQSSIEFIRNWILLNVSLKIIITLVSDFLYKLMKLPIGFFQNKVIGDLRQRLEDNSRVHQFLTNNVIAMLFGIFMFVMYSIVIALFHAKILLIFYAGTFIYILWILAFLKKRKTLDKKRFHQSVSDQNKIYEILTGVHDIKLNGWEHQKRWEWEKIQVKLFHISLESLKLGQLQNIGAVTIVQFVNLTITFIAATSVIRGEMTLGSMVAIQFIIGQLNGPVNEFVHFVTAAQDTKLSLERIREIHQQPDESTDIPTTYQLPEDNSVYLNGVSFGFSPGHLILKDINITIPHGKVTAIVGESGSGKTTLLKLMLRYFTPSAGTIHVGHVPLRDLDIRAWREACGVVMQDGIIFSDTIINNIAIGHQHINNDQLDQAVLSANIKDFITQLPNTYETMVGQGGLALSQGQQQRLLIARAVYRRPAMLFFDEATNALDSNNEATIVKRLNEFYTGKTVVIVAHRLSTIMNADQIIVMNNGRVVEVGNHYELLESRGHYHTLVKNQFEIANA